MSSPPPDPAAQAAAAAAFQQFTIEAWTLLGVGIAVTILRTISRIRYAGFRGLGGDDYLAWVAVLFYTAETSLAYSVGHVANGLANNGMTDAQRAALSPDDPEFRLRVIGSKIQLAGWSTYSTLLWTLKASLLVFYIRLTEGLARHYRIRIYIGFAFLASSYLVVALNLYLSCRPFQKFWQIFPDPGIPLPMLWGSSLKPLKKAGLMLLFSSGIFVVVCATLRCVLIVLDTENGAQLAGSWAVRETFVAVVTTNLPMIFPLLKGLFGPIFGSILDSMRSTQKSEGLTPKGFVTFGGTSKSWRGRGPPTANPITNFTMNESEERMVESVGMQNLKAWSDSRDQDQGHQLGHDEEGGGIRKYVEIDIVHEDRPKQTTSRVTNIRG
ncbi:hypothetical protein TASIC1_0015000900 [Trichoderma asperellum]|uniref:Rhodopsin domain-containing protein n=1 Tax=Trichoderma asperellum TaxID=101201 RepID=A0A6V8R5H4_TRIAP|nr:hypothetical protein TASIC1_0015000900 [Trichoderma asperellum]